MKTLQKTRSNIYTPPLPYIVRSIVMYLYSDICKYFMFFGFWLRVRGIGIRIHKIVVISFKMKSYLSSNFCEKHNLLERVCINVPMCGGTFEVNA